MKNKFIKRSLILATCLTALATSCSSNSSEVADTVVYSKIYTSNKNHDYVEAFAVKDGKYIYVGNKEGAKKYIKEGTTKVIDNSSNFVMSGATEGHAHYMVFTLMQTKGAFMPCETIEGCIEGLKTQIKENPDQKLYLTAGWLNRKLFATKDKIDIRAMLDEIESEKPVILIDDTGHNLFMNSKTIELAGIDANTTIAGGSFSKDSNNRLLGLATDIAMNYVLKSILNQVEFLSDDDFAKGVEACQDLLHSYGYTGFVDPYTSYFGENGYKALKKYDDTKGLTFNIQGSFKIDPFDNVDECITTATKYKETYTSTHFKPDNVKIFADGECVETKSGWVIDSTSYKDGSHGTQVWSDEQMNYMVKELNKNGINAHVHASGDAAARQTVNAMVAAKSTAKEGIKNTLAHCFAIKDDTMTLMAENDISASVGITWRIMEGGETIEKLLKENFDYDWFLKGYPMKTLFEKGINMTCSTDFPANAGGPVKMLDLLELAVNNTTSPEIFEGKEKIYHTSDELLSLTQGLDAMTINGAKQIGNESERGSIEVGKYADFIVIDKDLTSIDKTEIHNAGLSNVYFEGKLVYTAKK